MADVRSEYEGEGEFYFLKLMAEEIENEYIQGSTFRSESWQRVMRKFCKIYGPIFTVLCLKARLRSLKKRHQKFSELISHEGVFWNKKHNVVSGNQEVLKKYQLKSYGRTGFYNGEEHFDLMRQIFESGVKLD
ncbi:unnamed protein product [Fraxinus pennsylvanica]|uniref:Myb/SANT-like domain-containing protein n=1 Tax=Fraxinus pennsylvanica TaxID=56036 RepID=A0AAD2DU96_9LAMI|nr:unnamed protein product [Fraxinus pennsylvanica]